VTSLLVLAAVLIVAGLAAVLLSGSKRRSVA
jgi:hypothetical protein